MVGGWQPPAPAFTPAIPPSPKITGQKVPAGFTAYATKVPSVSGGLTPLALHFLPPPMTQGLLLGLHLQRHPHHLLWLPGRSSPQSPAAGAVLAASCSVPDRGDTIPWGGECAGKGTHGCHQWWLWGRTQAPGDGGEWDRAPTGGREVTGGGGCPCMGPQHHAPLPCSATRLAWPSTAACATRASPTGSPSLCSPCSSACSSTPSPVTPAPEPFTPSLPQGFPGPRLIHPPWGSSVLLTGTAAHPRLPIGRALRLPDLRRGRGVRHPDVLPRE